MADQRGLALWWPFAARGRRLWLAGVLGCLVAMFTSATINSAHLAFSEQPVHAEAHATPAFGHDHDHDHLDPANHIVAHLALDAGHLTPPLGAALALRRGRVEAAVWGLADEPSLDATVPTALERPPRA